MTNKSLIILVVVVVVALLGVFALTGSPTVTSNGEVDYSYEPVYEYTSNGVLHTPADGKQFVEVKGTLENRSSDSPIQISKDNLVFKAKDQNYSYVYSSGSISSAKNGEKVSFDVIYEISADASSGTLEWKGDGKLDMNKTSSKMLSSKTILRYNYTYSFESAIPSLYTAYLPDPGYTYLVLHVAVKNTTSKDVSAQSGPLDVVIGGNEYDYELSESTSYNWFYTFGGNTSKTVSSCKIPAGGVFKYYVVYEVPSGITSFSTVTDGWVLFNHYVKDPSITV